MRGGIRQQMLWATGVIVLAIFVLLVSVTLILGRYQLFKLGERNVRERVEASAARAAFATLVGAEDPSTARALIHELQATNGVQAAELVDARGHTLARSDLRARALDTCRFDEPTSAAAQTTVRTVAHLWCVSSPVFKREEDVLCTRADCVLGRLRVAQSTASVESVVSGLAGWMLLLGGALLTLSLVALWRVSGAISRPLIGISEVMRRFTSGERGVRALVTGPTEARTISGVYNQLIDAQEAQARELERQVEERTHQWREASAAAQEAERYKCTFMAHVSHEMKTPLHIIHSHASEVVGELEFINGAETAKERLGVIVRESEELTERVRQILELARGEASGAQLSFERIALPALAARVREKAEALARVNDNTVQLRADDEEVMCDVDKVLQIIMNLVANACRFTRQGVVSVTLSRQGPVFVIEVIDTGCGIPKEAQQRVWEEFRQVGDELRAGGFGLGLAIVRHYVQAMHGESQLSSQPDEGTRVTVRLPAQGAEISQR
jgi:signal transduction histidine kinase